MYEKNQEITKDGITIKLTMMDHTHVDWRVMMMISYEVNGKVVNVPAYPVSNQMGSKLMTIEDQFVLGKSIRRFDEKYVERGGKIMPPKS